MSRRSLLIPLVLVVLAALGALLAATTSNTTPNLVLGLQGGFSVVLRAKAVNGRQPSTESVEKAKDIIRQRVDGLGVAEPDITRQGRTVVVQLPGVTDQKKAESLVGCTAKLEFRPVLSVGANPNAPTSTTTTTTTKGKGSKGSKGTTTTTSGSGSKGTTTTTSGSKGTTTTTAATSTTGETGAGAVGIAPGQMALPGQFAPTTTTTTPPTTTAPPTTSTAPAASTTSVPTGSTTTTTAPSAATSTSCGSGSGSAAAVDSGSQGSFPSKDGALLYSLGPVGFDGEALSSATAALGSTGEWAVNVNIKGSQKGKANAAFNACNSGAPTCPSQGGTSSAGGGQGAIAIVLDGKVISAPTVNNANLADSTFQITGNFSSSEAKDLALVLRYGSLPVEFEQAALQQVSATLGHDSLHAGLIAGAIGIAAVALYMILYYRGLGLVVIAGLTVWGGLMYGLICWLGATQGLALSLSGITGIIVSVGTTVDSYVVFFERVKDEVRAGRSVRSSTEKGFASAFRTILTADISSFLGAFLLFWLTVGPVRGFAFFLGLSVLLDVVVAYLFTRPAVILLGRSRTFTNARFLGLASALDRAPEMEGSPA